jgi:hypothetical protein
MEHLEGLKYDLGLQLLRKAQIVFVCKVLKMEKSSYFQMSFLF